MALLSGFMPKLASKSDLLLGVGSGLVSGGTVGEQFGGAFNNAAAVMGAQRKAAEDKAKQNLTLQFLKTVNPQYAAAVEAGAMTPAEAYNLHVQDQKSAKPQATVFDQRAAAAAQYGLQPGTPAYQQFVLGGQYSDPNAPAGADEYGLNPIVTTRDGKTVLYAPSKSGTVKELAFPQGVQPMGPMDKAYQTGMGREMGEYTGNQRATAEKDVTAANQALGILDQIETHPYLERGTGMSSLGNAVPGTGGYDFQRLVDQAKSGAFLAAIQQMRGLGQLSNVEGQAATAAVTRMDTATSREAFLKALADYRAVIMAGRDRSLRNMPSQPAMNGAGQTSSGLKWSIEP